MPILMVPSAPSGTLAYTWLQPQVGTPHALTNNAFVNVQTGERGLGLPQIDLAEDKLPFAAGTVVRHAAIQSRMIELPLLFSAASASDLEALMDTVYSWFATADEQRRTPGYLRVTRRDNTQRQIACYYAGGLEGDLSSGEAGEDWQTATVLLKAADPWATAIASDSASWLSTDGDLPTVSIINDGTLDAYPIWTITGPATAVNINNTTVGLGWLYTSSLVGFNLAAGKTLTIDSRLATARTTLPVLDSDGVSRYSSFHPSSSMFTLAPGQNNFEITFAGNSGATEIEVSWLPRFRGLHR